MDKTGTLSSKIGRNSHLQAPRNDKEARCLQDSHNYACAVPVSGRQFLQSYCDRKDEGALAFDAIKVAEAGSIASG